MQYLVKVFLDRGEGPGLDLLFYVEALDALHHHFRDHTDGADPAYSSLEQVILRHALVHFTLAVDHLESHDRLVDEPPIPPRSVHVGRQDPRDALGVVGR